MCSDPTQSFLEKFPRAFHLWSFVDTSTTTKSNSFTCKDYSTLISAAMAIFFGGRENSIVYEWHSKCSILFINSSNHDIVSESSSSFLTFFIFSRLRRGLLLRFLQLKFLKWQRRYARSSLWNTLFRCWPVSFCQISIASCL